MIDSGYLEPRKKKPKLQLQAWAMWAAFGDEISRARF